MSHSTEHGKLLTSCTESTHTRLDTFFGEKVRIKGSPSEEKTLKLAGL